MADIDVKELAAQLAEAVRASLKPELDEIKERIGKVEARLDTLEQAVNELKDELQETTETTSYLVRDVYLLKNRKQ
jgi:prefoldin subunit 5